MLCWQLSCVHVSSFMYHQISDLDGKNLHVEWQHNLDMIDDLKKKRFYSYTGNVFRNMLIFLLFLILDLRLFVLQLPPAVWQDFPHPSVTMATIPCSRCFQPIRGQCICRFHSASRIPTQAHIHLNRPPTIDHIPPRVASRGSPTAPTRAWHTVKAQIKSYFLSTSSIRPFTLTVIICIYLYKTKKLYL